jgi:hypothetical protein
MVTKYLEANKSQRSNLRAFHCPDEGIHLIFMRFVEV